MQKEKRWLTPQELEAEYGICESTQAKYRMDKKIPYSRIGRKLIKYDRLKIDAWIEDHEIVGDDYEK